MTRTDRRKSRIEVQQKLNAIVHRIRSTNSNGGIYKNKIRTAGSCSTQTQVGKATEFDFNFPLDINVTDIEIEGYVHNQFRNPNVGNIYIYVFFYQNLLVYFS